MVQGEVNIRVPKSKGIAGAVATSGKVRSSTKQMFGPRLRNAEAVYVPHLPNASNFTTLS